MVGVWRSEDNLRKLACSFYHTGFGIKLRSLGWAAGVSTYSAISSARVVALNFSFGDGRVVPNSFQNLMEVE